MITLLIRHETPMGPRTRLVREDDETRARETMVLFQSQGAEVFMTEMTGRKTVAELVRERDRRLRKRGRRPTAEIVQLKRRAE